MAGCLRAAAEPRVVPRLRQDVAALHRPHPKKNLCLDWILRSAGERQRLPEAGGISRPQDSAK
jgi:hypothetical protein